MNYTTKLRCSISVFHESIAVADIESAIGRRAEKRINRGDPRPGKGTVPFDRSSAIFEVISDGERDPQAAISDCLDIFEKSADMDVLQRGHLWINLGLLDPDFVQVALDQELIARLSRSGVGLAIENRAPRIP